MAENIPGAKYVELPGEDLFWWLGDADGVVDEVEEFVTGVRPTPKPDRVLATVLFTDIVGSTERASELGDRRWRAAGLHTGEIELRGEDIAGLAVHIGARVAALAGPGEVLVSGTVPPLVAGSGLEFSDRGSRELKGVPGVWNVFAVQPPASAELT
jgi:class 3 adenylate cyclase